MCEDQTGECLPEVCETPKGHGSSRSETRDRKSDALGGQQSGIRERRVVGDGTQGRSCRVNRGDLSRQRWVFTVRMQDTKSPLDRSQSAHRSVEAG